MEVLAGLEPAPLEDRLQTFASRPRVGRGLENHELTFAQTRRDLGHRTLDDGEVRLALARERRRQCDQDRVDLLQRVVVRRRRHAPRIDERLERVRRDVRNVAGSPIDAVDDLRIHVDQKDDLAGVRKDARKRHAHVPGTDDGHVCSHARTRLLRASKSGSAFRPRHDDFQAVPTGGRSGVAPGKARCDGDGTAVRRRYTWPPLPGPLAQLVEQGTLNPKVAGSIPARPIADRSPARLTPSHDDFDRVLVSIRGAHGRRRQSRHRRRKGIWGFPANRPE